MIMNYSKVDGYKNLVRDNSTKAILNTNKTEYKNYISLREQKNKECKKVQELEEDLANIKNDLNEIKQLLRRFSDGSR
jgi:hypothetical protein